MPNCKSPPQGVCPGTGRRSSSEGQKRGSVGQGSCGASFARREQPGVEAGWHSSRAGTSVRPAARPSRGLGGICRVTQESPGSMTAAWPSYLTAVKQWTTTLLSWGETSPHKECLVPLHVLITLQQLNVCFSGVRRAKSLELCLGDTQEDAHPCAGLVWSKAEPSTIQTDWILQTGKLSHRLVQQH